MLTHCLHASTISIAVWLWVFILALVQLTMDDLGPLERIELQGYIAAFERLRTAAGWCEHVNLIVGFPCIDGQT